jgi:signal transduction histidine kinase/CheY-like chemotaxis protein
MENARALDILVVNDDNAPFLEFRELLAPFPGLTPYFAASLSEALHILSHNTIHCLILATSINRRLGIESHKLFRELVPDMPILLWPRKRILFPHWRMRRLRKEGVHAILPGPLASQETLDAVYRAVNGNRGDPEAERLRERFFFSLSHAEEKISLMQTALDILSHDTKDLFIRILSLIAEIPENEHTGVLNDYVNELYDCTSEALGFISAQKRLESLIDVVNGIRIGREKLPLPSHSRIDLTYGPRRLLFVECSRLLKNALANIIENALKYSPPEEKIRIEIARLRNEISLKVTDRGIGIPENDRPYILRRNFRSAKSRDFEGSGKGLWIAYNIVKDEKGEIFIENNPDGGTIMTVLLPVFSLQHTEHRLTELSEWFKLPLEVVEKKARIMKTILLLEFPESAWETDSLVFANLLDHFRDERRKKERQKYFYKLREFTRYNPNGRSVLLVDDSLYVHYSIAPLLTDQGFRIVDFAFNGVEAFNLYQIFNPELVIMDITMPMKSGIETAQDIFKKNPHMKILFVTALGEYKPLLENIERLFWGKNYRLVSKPIRPLKLLEAINALCEGKPDA